MYGPKMMYGLARTFPNHRYDDQTPVTPIPSSNPLTLTSKDSTVAGLQDYAT